MTEYAPGTVAVATVRGKEGVRVLRADDPLLPWRSTTEVQETRMHSDRDVFTVRPLVVLDPSDWPDQWNQPARGGSALRHWADLADDDGRTAIGAALRYVADQIEAQTKQPRIPEPGKYGVVRDKHGVEWVTYGSHRWVQLDKGLRDWPWVDIEDPALVREGVDA